MFVRPFVLALVGLGLAHVGVAQERGPMPREAAKAIEIPYRLTDTKHVLVRVKLNGQGPFNFIIDTGAPALILQEAIAKKVNAKPDNGWVTFDKMELEGGLPIADPRGVATDMFQLKGMNAMGLAGVELHGVIGYNILARYRIQYDFNEPKLVWTPVNFDVPAPKRISDADKKGSQGGLELIGELMKFMAAFGGIKPNYAMAPRGFLGAELDPSAKELVVKSVVPDGPAALAGLKAGDRIQTAQSKDVDTPSELLEAVKKLPEGAVLKLKVKRGNDTKEFAITLGKGL